jgi:hypothetical protein
VVRTNSCFLVNTASDFNRVILNDFYPFIMRFLLTVIFYGVSQKVIDKQCSISKDIVALLVIHCFLCLHSPEVRGFGQLRSPKKPNPMSSALLRNERSVLPSS